MKKLSRWIADYPLTLVGTGAMLLMLSGVLWMDLAAPKTAHAQIPNASQALPWTCSLDDIGATLTKCVLNAGPQPDSTQALYLTTVIGESTTATAGLFLLRFGSGTNCGTGTTSVLPSAATVPRLAYPANTAPPTTIFLTTPLKIPAGKDLCLIGSATNTFTGQLAGYLGPM